VQVEKHQFPDGGETIISRLFLPSKDLREKLGKAYREAMEQETCTEVKQAVFDPDDLCPCGSKRKAKNCCAARLVRKLAMQREKGNE
jgi:hypothetical protein